MTERQLKELTTIGGGGGGGGEDKKMLFVNSGEIPYYGSSCFVAVFFHSED